MTRPVGPPVVEILRRRGPRPVEPPSAPLPPVVLTALAAIVRDMRDVPRDCLLDRAELVHWLRRMAGRVEGVGRMRVPDFEIAQKRKLTRMLVSSPYDAVGKIDKSAPATPRDLAEAVFGKGSSSTRAQGPRTIVGRRGRVVRVEVRRARAAGQMELGV